MKRYFILLPLVLPFIANTQTTRFSIETEAGYEYNISQNAPELTDENGELLLGIDAMPSSFFNKSKFGFDYRKKKKKHIFGLDANASYTYFLSYQKANTLNMNLTPEHKVKLSKKWFFLQEGQLKMVNRNIENELVADFNLRTPYNLLGYEAGLKFLPAKGTRITLLGSVAKKKYKPAGNANFKYDEYGGELIFSKSLDKERGLTRLELETSYKKRFYQQDGSGTIRDEDGTVLQGDGELNLYTMRFIRVAASTKFMIGDNIYFKPGVFWVNRKDPVNDFRNYNQYGAKFLLKYKNDKNAFALRGNISRRLYPVRFSADVNGNTDLDLIYIRTSFDYERFIGKRSTIFFSAELNKRTSNYDIPSKTAFRPYLNTGFSVGWRLALGKK